MTVLEEEADRKRRQQKQMSSLCSCSRSFVVSSPVGSWNVVYCSRGLHWVKLREGESQDIDTEIMVSVKEGEVKQLIELKQKRI